MKEANILLRALITSIIINDGKDDTEIVDEHLSNSVLEDEKLEDVMFIIIIIIITPLIQIPTLVLYVVKLPEFQISFQIRTIRQSDNF